MTAQTTVPRELVAGDTWSWSSDYADYPAGTWSATVYMENKRQSIDATATVSGTAHLFTIAAAATAEYPAGRYRCHIRVSAAGVVNTIDEGWVEVLSNPAASGNRDHRSWARRTLDAVEAFLEDNASTAQQSMSIQGRSISRWSMPELMEFRTQLRAEVRTEEAASSAGLGRYIKVRLSRG